MQWQELWAEPSQFLQRGEKLLQTAEKTHDPICLLYAALETRYCIERFFISHLASLTDVLNSTKYSKHWHAKGLHSAILEVRPDYLHRLRFYRLWQIARGFAEPFDIPDFELICKIYGRLGNYLHLPLGDSFSFYPPSQLTVLYDFLNDSLGELRRHCYSDKPPFQMNPRLEIMLQEMIEKNITDQEMLIKLLPTKSQES